jgi:hypothetical protein
MAAISILFVLLLQIGLPLAVIAGGIWLFARTDAGRTVLDRLRGSSHNEMALRDLADEIANVREDVMDIQERLDFTDRVLGQLRRELPDTGQPETGESPQG